METKPKIGLGIESFSELITAKGYYVDKTCLIRDIREGIKKITLFTRPRRFGKSLALNMLADFFDVTKKEANAHLFDGLKITEDAEFCREHQNAYPVVSLSFKDVKGPDFQYSLDKLTSAILGQSELIDDLLDKVKLSKDDIKILKRIDSDTCQTSDLALYLRIITKVLNRYYGKKVIVLLDEYDVPIQNAFLNGFFKEMTGVISDVMSTLFKGNPYLDFGVITGCLRITKESIFTGMNNLVVNTVLTPDRPEYFGFTQSEVEKLLADCGLSGEVETVRRWYDGYKFGTNDVYNPWSVLSFADQGMLNPKNAAAPYWINTSANDILLHLIRHCEPQTNIHDAVENLINGGSVIKPITDNAVFSDFRKNPDLIWSVLLFTGYLKSVPFTETEDQPRGCRKLVLPNEEIRGILIQKHKSWFDSMVENYPHKKLAKLFFTGNAQTAEEKITRVLKRTISVRDGIEIFYEGILAGLLTSVSGSYTIRCNSETGSGYSDIVMKSRSLSTQVIIEIKRGQPPKSPPTVSPDQWEEEIEESFEDALDKAENQIRNRRYAEKTSNRYKTKIAYAAAFVGKECRLRKVEI